jgi:hypothetical protein
MSMNNEKSHRLYVICLLLTREGKRPLGRPGRRREENIKANLQEVGCVGYGLD